MDPLNDLHELEAAEARRRAEYEQRHAELVRDASRSLGKARLSKSAGASPVLAPVGHPGQGIMFMPGTSPVRPSSGSLCIRESGAGGVPLPPSCCHEDCQKSYRKALKAWRRFSGPALPLVPSLTLDVAATSPSSFSNHSFVYHSGALRTRQQFPFRARSGSPSHMHSYSPYPRVSPPFEKERDSYAVVDNTSPIGGSSSSSLSDFMFSAPTHGISPGISNERSTSGPISQAQYTPSASPFLRPLQSLGLDSPSVSPKMEHSALGMLAPSDARIGEMGNSDTGIRIYEPTLGKRRDSSTTVTHHDFPRAHLRPVLPQVKSESTPTSPTWRYFQKPILGSSASPPPMVDAGTTSTSSSPPSPALHSQSLPHTPHFMRGQPPHHHLAHSVRMAFAMTPIKDLDSVSSQPHQLQNYTDLSSHSTPHPSMSSSSSSIHNLYKPQAPGSHFSFSRSSSRSGSPPIMLPPLSASTPNSTATASSRAPSPTGYITLPPLKVHATVGTVKPTAHVSPYEAVGISGDGTSILTSGDSISHSSATPGDRITLPGFSELIRAADS